MPKLIFVDIGGHLGQSVEVALRPDWRFDHVHTFEPDETCARHIEDRFKVAVAAGRLTVHHAALADKGGTLTLYGDNAKGGASVVAGALANLGTPTQVEALDVNRFIAALGSDVRLYLKLNCEGGEVAILNRLCELPDKSRIAGIVADFDVVKMGFGYFEKRGVIRRVAAAGMPMMLSERVMVGKTHALRLANWLKYFPEIAAPGTQHQPRPQLLKRRIKYGLRDLRSAVGLNAKGYRRKG